MARNEASEQRRLSQATTFTTITLATISAPRMGPSGVTPRVEVTSTPEAPEMQAPPCPTRNFQNSDRPLPPTPTAKHPGSRQPTTSTARSNPTTSSAEDGKHPRNEVEPKGGFDSEKIQTA